MNPHNWLTALDPPYTDDRRWRCNYCKLEGTFEEVQAVECTFVYPPCDSCGLTPTCAPDCKGAAAALELARGAQN